MTVGREVRPVAHAEAERAVAVAGSVRGAMIITGDNNTVEMVMRGVGAVLAFAFRWDRPRRRRRRERRHACPPRFDNHVDREEQVAALLPVDGSPRVVNVYGPAQIGKTHVLVEALNRRESAMRHGTVFLDGRGRSADDLLHAVFDELFECRVKRRDLRIERLLSGRRAVLALEDVELEREDAQRLVLGASRCRFLVTSRSRVLFDATPVSLGGLEPEFAVVIAEQELGRLLGDRERRAVETITARLGGHPLALRQAFSRTRDEGRPLDELEPLLVGAPDAGQRLAALTPPQLRAARALAVHGEASLGDEHLRAVAGADALAAAGELEARHDATSHSPRHSLIGALAQALVQDDLAEETDRALEHFTAWAQAHGEDNQALLGEAPALLALLERADAARRWPEVIRLGRAIEGAYAVGQRWAAWGRVIELMLKAARHSEDPEAEGWALHQLGTRSYGLGDIDDARELLHQALELRERIGDRAGAAATRQNLRVISGPAPLLHRLSHLPLAVVATIAALLIGAGGVAGAQLIGGDDPPVAQLTIGVHGDGLVASNDGSIRCAETECREDLPRGRELVLRAQPRLGWEFARWSRACSGAGICRLALTADTHVAARFRPVREPREVTVNIQGKGTVVSHPAGLTCQADQSCQATFTRSRRLELTAAAARGQRFVGWSGDCQGTKRCVIDDDEPQTVVHARFVADPKAVTLGIDVQGDGLGRVISRQSGIDCGQLCAASYRRGSRVLLTALAQPGSRFAGWSDPACPPPTRDKCTVTLDRNRNLVARFDRSPSARPPGSSGPALGPARESPGPRPQPRDFALTVSVNGDGRGRVSSNPPGINACADRCEHDFETGADVTLQPSPSRDSRFVGWRGDCSGTEPCSLPMDQDRSVIAIFAPKPAPPPDEVKLTIEKDGNGTGIVTSTPAGITCGKDCESAEATFYAGTEVTLTATPDPPVPSSQSDPGDPGSSFEGWRGPPQCTQESSPYRKTCTITLRKDLVVTAAFSSNFG